MSLPLSPTKGMWKGSVWPKLSKPAKVLKRAFYERDTRVVACELIGKILVFEDGGTKFCGRIVETEAYLDGKDPASHAFRGMTPRNRVMFGPPGFSYVYFTYGFHHCFNVVTERDGVAGAVLIRAAEPLSGIEQMKKRRGIQKIHDVTNGPGKLTQAYGLTREHSGLDLTDGKLRVEDDLELECELVSIGVSERIGIREPKKLLYRFFWEGNPFVSRT